MDPVLSLFFVWWPLAIILVLLLVVFRRSPAKKKVRRPRRGVDRGLTYPRQYPCGWYRICDSDDVAKRGQTKHVCALGREMVVFRSDDEHAQVSVLDAFCVHMGANLAFGGKVMPGSNCLQCPFHLWEFNGQDGRCTKIPYLDGSKIPDKARIQSYTCVERHGMVMIWYHPLNEPPHYDAICIDELFTDRFSYRGAYHYPNIRMHLQEFAENAADLQHFHPLHGQMLIPWTQLRVPLVYVNHQASLVFGDESHIVYFYDTAMLKIFGRKYESTKVDASITFYGPGGITLFRFDGQFGRIYLFHTHTPTDYMQLDVEFRAFVEKKIPRWLSWYIIGNWIAQWQQDIIVWENKVHKRAPFLVKNDGPIMKMRRWYNEFYLSKEQNEIDKDESLDW